jgi:hypothetical protein
MKKYIAIGFLALIIPLQALAVEKPAGITQENGRVWDVLIVLIGQLTTQIDKLTQENKSLRVSCGTLTPVSTVPATSNFGTQTMTTQPPNQTSQTNQQSNVPEQGGNKITLTLVAKAKVDNINNMPFGSFIYRVSTKDANGKSVPNVVYDVIYPEDAILKQPKVITNAVDGTTGEHYGSVEYIPTTKGVKTLTVKGSNVETSVTVDVK